MATQTKKEIKELGFEVSFIFFCMKLNKSDEEIMDRCSITRNRLNKAYNKLIELKYIRHNGYTILEQNDSSNVPQNAPSEVINVCVAQSETIIKENNENDMEDFEVIDWTDMNDSKYSDFDKIVEDEKIINDVEVNVSNIIDNEVVKNEIKIVEYDIKGIIPIVNNEHVLTIPKRSTDEILFDKYDDDYKFKNIDKQNKKFNFEIEENVKPILKVNSSNDADNEPITISLER